MKKIFIITILFISQFSSAVEFGRNYPDYGAPFVVAKTAYMCTVENHFSNRDDFMKGEVVDLRIDEFEGLDFYGNARFSSVAFIKSRQLRNHPFYEFVIIKEDQVPSEFEFLVKNDYFTLTLRCNY